MIVALKLNNISVKVDLWKPLDISIPLRAGLQNVNAFHIPPVTMEPFKSGNFIGDVNQGGSCNVFSISFNPHGNGTHTETVGHISKEKYPINDCLKQFFFEAQVISILPEMINGDRIITKKQLEMKLEGKSKEALIIRTIPNENDKINFQYSGTNPPYMEESGAVYLRELSVKHLLLDVPSIDREDDNGKLSAHHAFWNYPKQPRIDCTITELIYVPDSVIDGFYLLNLQIASFVNDASPSKPILYEIMMQ